MCKRKILRPIRKNRNHNHIMQEKRLTIRQMLEGTTPIDAPKHNFKNIKEARIWAKENIVGEHKNIDTGYMLIIS